MEKEFLSKKKTPKGGDLKGVKEEVVLHITLQYIKLGPICAHLQKDVLRLGQYLKNNSPKALERKKIWFKNRFWSKRFCELKQHLGPNNFKLGL